MIKIMGISGSLREKSVNTTMLRTALGLIPDGTSLEIVNIGGLPLYNDDLARLDPPEPVKRFRQEVVDADGILIASPEYNYSFTGVLKNALDWAGTNSLGNTLSEKPVAIMGASKTVYGTARGQLHLRQVLHAANAMVIQRPSVYVRRAHKLIDEDGKITDSYTIEKIKALVDKFVDHVERGK